MKHKHLSNPKKCKSTGKTRYKKRKYASIAMMRVISHDPNADMFDLHTYICPDCKGWHFGHQKWYKMQQANT